MRFMVMHKVDARMEAGGPSPQRIIQAMGEFVQSAIKSNEVDIRADAGTV